MSPKQLSIDVSRRVLQGLLSSVTGKHTRSGGSADPRVVSLASNQVLQLALLTCAVELTCYCTSAAASFPIITSTLGQISAGLDIWEACGHFLHYLAAETTTPMAGSVSNYLLFMRIKVVEDLAWQTGSSLYQAICEGGGGSCNPGNYALICSFLESVAALARARVCASAAGVAATNTAVAKIPAFGDECLWLMNLVLQEHLDLLFNQHLSAVIACCVYGIARALGASLSFKKVIDTIMRAFPHHTDQDFKRAELATRVEGEETQYGDTRQLYNEVFLPCMSGALQRRFPGIHSVGQQKSEARRAPLKHLSATDMNARPSRFYKMQC